MAIQPFRLFGSDSAESLSLDALKNYGKTKVSKDELNLGGIMTKQLKDQFTLRIYNQEDKNLLDKAYSRCQSGFDTKTDFQRACLVVGAKKMLGDAEIDHSKNLSEINEKLEAHTKKLERLEKKLDVYEKELEVSFMTIEYLCNFIANVVFNSNGNVEVNSADVFDGLFTHYDLYQKMRKLVYGDTES